MLSDRFELTGLIGSGCHGRVFAALERATGQPRALKEIYGAATPSCKQYREIELLQCLAGQPNILRYHRHYQHHDNTIIECDYFDADIQRLTHANHWHGTAFDHVAIRSIAHQLLTGLSALHNNHCVHRDLKPSNLLIDRHGHLVIADFGQARWITSNESDTTGASVSDDRSAEYSLDVGTRWYRAPELLFGHTGYGTAVDLWSAGCILALLHTNTVLFSGYNEFDQIHRIVNILDVPPRESVSECQAWKDWDKISLTRRTGGAGRAWTGTGIRDYLSGADGDGAGAGDRYVSADDRLLVDLISSMIHWAPSKRVSAAQALHHPYFTGVSSALASSSDSYDWDAAIARCQRYEARKSSLKCSKVLTTPFTIGGLGSGTYSSGDTAAAR